MEPTAPPIHLDLAFSSLGESDIPEELSLPPLWEIVQTGDQELLGTSLHPNQETPLRTNGSPCLGDLHNPAAIAPVGTIHGTHTPDLQGLCYLIGSHITSHPRKQLKLPLDHIEEEDYEMDLRVSTVPTRVTSSPDEAVTPAFPSGWSQAIPRAAMHGAGEAPNLRRGGPGHKTQAPRHPATHRLQPDNTPSE